MDLIAAFFIMDFVAESDADCESSIILTRI